MAPRNDTTVKLPDGRRLAYTEWGDPNGSPVFLFHGTPHSRLWCPDEKATNAARVRLIVPDRPGIGRSDVREARTLADWPRDVSSLADALAIERFAAIGWSSGGAYAGACAALLAPRLTGVGIVNSRHLGQFNIVGRPGAYEELDPADRAVYDLAQTDPSAAAQLAAINSADMMTMMRDRPEELFQSLRTDGDRWFFDDEIRMASLNDARIEFFRQGMDGIRWELIDVFLPWGFKLADISIPLLVWHGEQDPLVKQVYIDFIGSHVRDSRITIWPDCGHLGIAKHWDEILEALT